MIQFLEFFRCAGVDEDIRHPGMIVPFGGSNVVAVGNDGKKVDLAANDNAIRVEVPDPTDMIRKRTELQVEMSQPGVDKALQVAYMPHSFYGDSSYFRIHGKRHVGFPGANLTIMAGGKPRGKMPVVVLDKIPVKIAIQNLQVYDSNGALVNHAKKPANAKTELEIINKIWVPQTLIEFEVVSAPPSIVDDRDPKTKAIIAKSLGLKDPANATVSSIVQADKLAPLFEPLIVPTADITIFVVDRLKIGEKVPNGVTLEGKSCIFVIGNRFPSTVAHEIGHFLGGEMKATGWDPMGHKDDLVYNQKTKSWDNTEEDYRLLMRADGAGFKIPFEHVKNYRAFRDRLKTKKH